MDELKAKVTLSVDEAWQELGGDAVISRATFYNAVGKGQIPHLRIGRRILIPRAAFLRWLETAQLQPAAQ